MARTKKYLTTPKASRGFYRPLKRLSMNPSGTRQARPVVNFNRHEIEEDLEKLEAQIAQAQALKDALAQQLAPPIEDHRKPDIEKSDRPHLSGHRYRTGDDSVDETLPRPRSTKRPRISTVYHEDEDPYQSAHDPEPDRYSLLEKELAHAIKKDDRFKDELKAMREEFEAEKKDLLKTIKALKQDVTGQKEQTPNKLLGISQELQQVVQAMDQLIQSEALHPQPAPNPVVPAGTEGTPSPQPLPVVTPSAPVLTPTPSAPTPEATPTPTPAPLPTPEVTPAGAPPSGVPTSPPTVQTKRKIPIPKPILVLGSTLLIVGAIGGGIWFFLNRETSVDTALLQEYLPSPSAASQPTQPQAQEEEKKIETSPSDAPQVSNTPASSTAPEPQTKGVSDQQYSESQAEVPFEQTKWETMRHPLGFSMDYPGNAVNMIRTETSITFIRKTGYIFKIQFIETALSVDEYWKLIKASSLSYKVNEMKFQDLDALFLELQDISDYPGNRYLVKRGDYVYDIWYATTSRTLSNEDAKRIEMMLKSFKFGQPSV